MTDDRIRELAARHAAYADSTLTLRGDAVVEFARDVLAEQGAAFRCRAEWRDVNDPPCHPSDDGWKPCPVCKDV